MTEPDRASRVERTAVANESGPPPEYKIAVAVSEKDKGKNGEAENDSEVIVEVEGEKCREGNSSKEAANGEELKQEKKFEDVSAAEQEDHDTIEAKDVKMVDAEDAKVVDEDVEKAEDAKMEHADLKGDVAEDEKMADMKDAKGEIAEDMKWEDAGNAKAEDAEDTKEEDDENTMAEEAEDVKAEFSEIAKAMDADKVNVDDVKDEEKGHNEVGEGGATQEEDIDMKQDEDIENAEENEVARSKKKRSRRQRTSHNADGMEKKIVEKMAKELTSNLTSTERPVRERKTVERLVEVIEKERSREFQVEKGRGTPLKDIPNVAYRLARKNPTDIKLIHQTLFGRKGKAVNFKSHILQFSGFVWHESDEKQRAKMKEKLDKYVKDTLLDLCDLFDLPVSSANSKKEDLLAKLLDFLVAPHAMTDVLHFEDQTDKSRKRKRMVKGSASKSPGSSPTKGLRKKRTKTEKTPNGKGKGAQETEDEEEEDKEEDDDDIGFSGEEKVPNHSGSEVKESDSEKISEDKEDEDDMEKGKSKNKNFSKEAGSAGKGKLKVGTSSKKSPGATTKSPSKTPPSSKRSNIEDDNDVGAKVFSRKRKTVDSPKKRSTPKSDNMEKDTGKKVSRGKAKTAEEHPSKEELRNKICEILKEVDFNTQATFTDILKQLAAHYKVDLTPRKASLKLMIHEELTRLAEAAEKNEEDERDVETAGKVEA